MATTAATLSRPAQSALVHRRTHRPSSRPSPPPLPLSTAASSSPSYEGTLYPPGLSSHYKSPTPSTMDRRNSRSPATTRSQWSSSYGHHEAETPGSSSLTNYSNRGIKRNTRSLALDGPAGEEHVGEAIRHPQPLPTAPTAASPPPYPALPSMRTQPPPFESFSSTGGGRGHHDDAVLIKKAKGSQGLTEVASTRSNIHLPRNHSGTVSAAEASEEFNAHHQQYSDSQQLLPPPPRGSSLLLRTPATLARNNEQPSPLPAYEDSPSPQLEVEASPRMPPPSSATTSHPGPQQQLQHPHLYPQQIHQNNPHHKSPHRFTSAHSPSRHQEHGSVPPMPPSDGAPANTSYDGANVPLSMRRGDAAHAKASKLHIDVPTTSTLAPPPSQQNEGGESTSRSLASRSILQHSHSSPSHHSLHQPQRPFSHGPLARSAPPTKVAFLDRGEGPGHIDPRMEGSRAAESRYMPYPDPQMRQQHPQHQPLQRPKVYQDQLQIGHPNGRRPRSTSAGEDDDRSHFRRPSSRSPPLPAELEASTVRPEGGPSPQGSSSYNYLHHPSSGPTPPLRGVGQVAFTPLSSRFVPQTATFPSPAYHTNRIISSSGVPATNAPLSGPSQLPTAIPSWSPTSGGRGEGGGQLGHPSPVSSKSHFLSLFSTFYDSLSDSRTLKLTLEDQVRRSNALLQTLQKSSNVLEGIVERRLREERRTWEKRMEQLEGEIRELRGDRMGREDHQQLQLQGEEEQQSQQDPEDAQAIVNVSSPSATISSSMEAVKDQTRLMNPLNLVHSGTASTSTGNGSMQKADRRGTEEEDTQMQVVDSEATV